MDFPLSSDARRVDASPARSSSSSAIATVSGLADTATPSDSTPVNISRTSEGPAGDGGGGSRSSANPAEVFVSEGRVNGSGEAKWGMFGSRRRMTR